MTVSESSVLRSSEIHIAIHSDGAQCSYLLPFFHPLSSHMPLACSFGSQLSGARSSIFFIGSAHAIALWLAEQHVEIPTANDVVSFRCTS